MLAPIGYGALFEHLMSYVTKYEASSTSHTALSITVGYIQIFIFITCPNFPDRVLEHWMQLAPIRPRL